MVTGIFQDSGYKNCILKRKSIKSLFTVPAAGVFRDVGVHVLLTNARSKTDYFNLK